MMAVREVARKRKFMLLILMQLLDNNPPATIKRPVWIRERIKRREKLGPSISRISDRRHPWVWRGHEDASCQVPSISGRCRPLLTKQETHMRTSIAPNERLALAIRYL